MPPRIFVSSVMEGYAAFRDAARHGIQAAGAEPVLVEDFPSLASTPRNACLDGVASCDGLVLLVGGRGGCRSPSGRLVVEEEFEEAQRLRLIVLAFVEETVRDDSAEALETRVSAYVDGRFRRTFRGPDDLQEEVARAVHQAFDGSPRGAPRMATIVDELLDAPETFAHEASVRLVITPERDEQVLDPVEFERPSFRRMVNEIAHQGATPILSYDFGKTYEVTVSSFSVAQRPENRRAGPLSHVHLRLAEDGTVAVDLNVTGEGEGARRAFQSSMTVLEQDVAQALLTAFRFVGALYEGVDRFGRHQRFSYNTVLHNVGHRTLSQDVAPQQSYGMRMHNEGDIRAFTRLRIIGRADLAEPEAEVDAALAMFRRQLSGA